MHHAVHDRLRVHEHVDPLARQPEQPRRLDQLQPLVEHGRAVDADLSVEGRPVRLDVPDWLTDAVRDAVAA